MTTATHHPLALAVALALSSSLAHAANLPEYRGEDVVVTATRQAQPLDKTLSDVTVIDRDEIEQAGADSLATLLARQPGVQISNNGGAGKTTSVYLRGANANQTLVLVDGVRIVSATEGTTSIQSIPLEQIDHIEIVRGPASSLYGADAIGGVIQVFTKKGEGPASFTANLGVGDRGTLQAGVGVSGKTGNTAYALSVSQDQTRGFSASNANNPSFNPDRDGDANTAYTANVTQTWAPGQELTVRLFQSFDRSDFDNFGNTDPNLQDVVKTRLTGQSVESKNALTDAWTSTVRYARSQDRSETFINGNFAQHDSLFTTTQDDVLWQNDIKTRVGSFLAGASYTRQKVESSQPLDRTSRYGQAAFAGYQGEFGRNLLQASVRHDDDSQFGGKTTGQASYGFKLDGGWLLRAGYGTGFKAPTFNDLYYPFISFAPFPGSYSGNPNLKPETSHNGEVEVRWTGQGSHASLVAFRNRIDNLIDLVTDGAGNMTSVNVNRANIDGVTLAAGTSIWYGIDLNGTATFQNPENLETGKWLDRRARQTATISASRAFGPVTLGAEWQAVGRRFDDPANLVPLHGYAVANLFANYEVSRDWSLNARVNNVANRDYELARGYNTGGLGWFFGARYAPK
ncbi:TonB-dependent receptor [Crenobacter sp. SG2303]|uniref:TonB-dependent receptor n=1 Tax=Crenobacter oryzisoli TaxID=3056844 RepID=A0ABT7XUP9_9NEIS|nr:TonB-dependent receptor [Crenobacter sp. SG2303]MDN0077517.1 TonB-dependent receptor [Crenobacter sp. SG2303]